MSYYSFNNGQQVRIKATETDATRGLKIGTQGKVIAMREGPYYLVKLEGKAWPVQFIDGELERAAR